MTTEKSRPRRRAASALALVGLATLGVVSAPAARAAEGDATIALELNKLEPVTGACRVYLTVRNGGGAYEALGLDLVLFGRDGVIARRLSAEIGPLRAGKRQVRLFDIPGADCDAIGGVLVNDVLDCKPASGGGPDPGACLDRLEVGSRVAGVDLSR